MTASPMAGSSGRTSVLRARIVTWLPSRAKACASSSATTDEPITARRSGIVSLTRPRSKSSRVTLSGPESAARPGWHPVATRQRSNEHHDALATLVQTDDEALVVLETRFTVQNGNGRIAVQDAFVFGVAQFIDTGLLLGQQFAAGSIAGGCRRYRRRTGFPGADGRYGRRGS